MRLGNADATSGRLFLSPLSACVYAHVYFLISTRSSTKSGEVLEITTQRMHSDIFTYIYIYAHTHRCEENIFCFPEMTYMPL